MNKKVFIVDLKKLNKFAHDLSKKITISDIILLEGDIGSGKTTLARYIIKKIFLFNKLKQPNIIPSPSFPILLTYALKKFEIYHYDFYRINKQNEISEINFEENIKDNITIIEWPNKIKSLISSYQSINIEMKILDKDKRKIIVKKN